ncbi:XcbB/CpsF family capsular polysaccharide biosynthesis protein [Lactococcus cremoris]|uniref:XcbB/CpsF family capsular polysaccharide biosynthesis protein n=1 Tax=Lactococcus lactis subsp. cremoris TaxID=1359 RepID=UPI0003AB9F39|nr:XcbB/CpsF family capsular polysaccharide biosynthesis protein [Lactococcus cremoris]AGV72865.1 hypothetical protein kw2_0907 [Lactococcus cremoris subsp. cremoris KW2]
MKNFEVSPEKDHKSMDTFLEDWDYYATLRQYALENKTIDGYKNGRYIVKNRTEIATKLDSYEEVYYDLEAPHEKENYLTNKLIVFFMPADAMTSPSAEKRYFGNAHWDSLAASIAKNTYILRIADTNLISGSYYQNTSNFPNYEEIIQNLIKKIALENNISPRNIITYGNSRGATGALYHGLLGNYKVVAADPVIDRKAWVERKDMQHMFDFIDYNMSMKINQLLAQTTLKSEDIKILSSDAAFITYPYINQLTLDKLTLLNLNLRNPYMTDMFLSHAIVIGKTVPLQLALINQLLYNVDLQVQTKSISFPEEGWDVLLPWSSSYFDLHLKSSSLQIDRNQNVTKNDNPWLNFMLTQSLEKGRNYVITLITDATDIFEKNNLFFHTDNYFEEATLQDKEVSESLPQKYIWKYEIRPKRELYYFGLNATTWTLGNSINIYLIKITKKEEN